MTLLSSWKFGIKIWGIFDHFGEVINLQ